MPTPVEHYEEAERLLDEAAKASDPLAGARMVTRASVEAALAAVPWSRDEADEVARGLDSEQVGALVAVVTNLAAWVDDMPPLPANVDAGEVEAWVAGNRAARDLVRRLVAPIAAEVLGE